MYNLLQVPIETWKIQTYDVLQSIRCIVSMICTVINQMYYDLLGYDLISSNCFDTELDDLNGLVRPSFTGETPGDSSWQSLETPQ